VRSAKEECLSKLILFGERSLRRALEGYLAHYHREGNHQGKDNVLLFPGVAKTQDKGPFDVESGSAGSCDTTIVRRLEPFPRTRSTQNAAR
jgi:hypothetical protein